MKQVNAYQADDGTLFASEEAALMHEEFLTWKERIDEFANTDMSDYKTGAHRGMVTKIIIGWERFKAINGVQK